MWLIVLFDLPVSTKADRISASKFRHNLLDLGFQMSQFSVYMKYCPSTENANNIKEKIKKMVPKYGNVKVIQITDKQFANILHLSSDKNNAIHNEQLALF